MGLFDKKNIVKIDKDDLKDAKLSSADYKDENIKKRAFINVLGARLAIKMLFSKKMEANNVYSLYTIHNVLSSFDIADIYYADIKIDVRLVFKKEEIFVPKSHFQKNLLPDLYLVLELKEDFSSAEFLGFFEPKSLDKNNANKDFYFFEHENLIDADKLKNFLAKFKPERTFIPSKEDFEFAEDLFLACADQTISKEDRTFLLNQLANSLDLREKFVEFENFELISRKVATCDALFKDGMLDIVGAQKLFEEDEVSTSKQDIKAEVIEEVLTDLIEPEEIDEKLTELEEEPKLITQEDEEFMSELIGSKDSEDKEKSQAGSDAGSAIGATVAGAVGGAIAGAVLGGAAASAAASLTAGVAAQEAIAQGAVNVLSAGADVVAEAAKEGIKSLSSKSEGFNNSSAVEDFDLNEIEELIKPDFEEDAEIVFEEPFDDSDILSKEEEINFDDSFSQIEEISSIEDSEPKSEDNVDEPEDDNFLDQFSEESEELVSDLEEEELSLDSIENVEGSVEEVIDEFEQEEDLGADEKVFLDNVKIEPIENIDILEEVNLENENAAQVEEIKEIESEVTENVEQIEESIIEDAIEPLENAFAPLEEITLHEEISALDKIQDVSMPELLPITDQKEEKIETIQPEDLIEGLPELALNFDAGEPEYLKNFSAQENLPMPNFAVGEEELNVASDSEFAQNKEEELFKFEEIGLESKPADSSECSSMDFESGQDEKENSVSAEDSEFSEENDETEEVVRPVHENRFLSEEEFLQEVAQTVEELPVKEEIKEKAIEEADSVISEVDDFLKNMDFSTSDTQIDEKELENLNLDFLNQDEKVSVLEPVMQASVNAEDKEASGGDETLQLLFKEKESEFADMFPTGKKIVDLVKKDKRIAIAASLAGVMLISLAVGGITTISKNNQAPQSVEAPQPSMADFSAQQGAMNPEGVQDAPMQQEGMPMENLGGENPQANRDMGQAMSDAFLSEPVNATITKVAWEVPEELAYNDGFRKYLQITGKNLKLNLQNDLLLASEMAYSNKVIIDLSITADGSLASSDVVSSSGSKQIDKIVLQSVKNTLKYLKMPANELNGQTANVTLIINF